jgi:hypothetical protein
MIAQEVLQKVRNGICAIGYLTVPHAQFTADYHQPFFKVVGTGFLVHDTVAMTCRHVIRGLQDYQADIGFPDDQRIVMFVHPHEATVWRVTISGISWFSYVESTEVDVGFVGFTRPGDEGFAAVAPLPVQSAAIYQVSEPIAICGYPYGHAMLQKDRKVYRWGPVVQQGFISAISPFDTAQALNEILLDVRIAGGMSGAPVFRPADGTVVGIVHSAWEATTALALPLDQQLITVWLAQHESHLKGAA